MKDVKGRLFITVLLICMVQPARSGEAYNRVNVSFTISGHSLLGLGFEHAFNAHHALQITAYPLIVPGNGFPFALQAGYNYYFNGSHWQGKLGGCFALLVSPPDPQERKYLPMVLLTPGLQYTDGLNYYSADIWLAHFLKKTNSKWPVLPIGLEAVYGREL